MQPCSAVHDTSRLQGDVGNGVTTVHPAPQIAILASHTILLKLTASKFFGSRKLYAVHGDGWHGKAEAPGQPGHVAVRPLVGHQEHNSWFALMANKASRTLSQAWTLHLLTGLLAQALSH